MLKQSKITVKEKGNGFIAYLNDNPAKWEYALTRSAAIGELVRSHCSEMKIELEIEWK